MQVAEIFANTCAIVNARSDVLNALKLAKFDLAVAEIFDVCAFG